MLTRCVFIEHILRALHFRLTHVIKISARSAFSTSSARRRGIGRRLIKRLIRAHTRRAVALGQAMVALGRRHMTLARQPDELGFLM